MLYVMQQNRELIWLRLLLFRGVNWEIVVLLLRRSDLECCFEAVLFLIISMSLTATLMAAKKAKGMSFADLEAAMGLDEVWVASLFYGQATASKEEAEKLAGLLSLDAETTAALQEYPTKGSLDPVIPTDPLIYRFYEIMQVYGMPLKDVIQEKFGDGIMSAIDFTLDVDKVEDPKGDRVKITMCGKFLPYKKW